MTGFEPWASGVRSDRSTNWVRTTATTLTLKFAFTIVDYLKDLQLDLESPVACPHLRNNLKAGNVENFYKLVKFDEINFSWI